MVPTDDLSARWAQVAGEHAPDQMLVLDDEGRVVWANRRGAGTFGWTLDEIIGRPVLELVHPDDLELTMASVSLLDVADAPPRPGRRRSLARDGSWIEVEVASSPSVEIDDRPVRVFTVRRNHQRVDELLAALAGDRPVLETMDVLVSGFRDPAYRSATVIRYHDSSGPVAVDDADLPSVLTVGVPGRSGVGPWDLVAPHDGPVVVDDLDQLATDVAAAARVRGFVGCVVQSVADPAGYPPACIVRWAGVPGMIDVAREWLPGEPSQLVSLVLQQRHRRELLDHAARHDPLTGLANRPQFFERLRTELSRRGRDQWGVALLYLDLDGFKQVNDHYGHGMGDTLLQQVAERLRRAVRPSDLVARLGGDEFAVVCSGPHVLDVAHEVADRLQARLSAPFDVDGTGLHIGVSIGIACDDELGEDELMELADRAMYESKAQGKGRASSARSTGAHSARRAVWLDGRPDRHNGGRGKG